MSSADRPEDRGESVNSPRAPETDHSPRDRKMQVVAGEGLVSTVSVVVVSGTEAHALADAQAEALMALWSWWWAETAEREAS